MVEAKPKGSSHTSTTASGVLWSWWVVGIVLVFAAAGYFLLPPPGASVSRSGEVMVLQWNQSTGMSVAGELSRLRVPVVVKGSQVTEWKAMGLWTPKYLASKVSFLQNAHNGSDALFVGMSVKEGLMDASLLPSPKNKVGHNFLLQDIHMKDFLHHDQAIPKVQYHYYSGPMGWWPDELHPHVMPIDFLQVDKEMAVASAWIGHKGVKLQCHFDRSYNLIVPVYGQQKWTLYPPEDWALFYLYPNLHPSYHRSQVDHDNPDLERFPLYSAPYGQEAILGPGDVLYIPPYWFHKVEALDTAVSVSVISPSEEELLWNQIQYFPLPFLRHTLDDRSGGGDSDSYEKEWPLFPHRVAAARLYLTYLIEQVIEDRHTATGFIFEAVVERRYGPLAAQLQKLVDADVERTIARHDCFKGREAAADGGEEEWRAKVEDWRARELMIQRELRKASFAQSRLLRDLLSVDDGVAAMVMANHVEQVANATVGWRNVLPFLRLCFPPQ